MPTTLLLPIGRALVTITVKTIKLTITSIDIDWEFHSRDNMRKKYIKKQHQK